MPEFTTILDLYERSVAYVAYRDATNGTYPLIGTCYGASINQFKMGSDPTGPAVTAIVTARHVIDEPHRKHALTEFYVRLHDGEQFVYHSIPVSLFERATCPIATCCASALPSFTSRPLPANALISSWKCLSSSHVVA